METRMKLARDIAAEVRIEERRWRIAREAKVAREAPQIGSRKQRDIRWALFAWWLTIRRRDATAGVGSD
jgi:hypothetical protein